MKKREFLFLAMILTSALIAYILINIILSEKGARVEVLIDGEIVNEFSLDEDIKFRIESEKGYNQLVIENGTAKISDASCPDQLCVEQKSISSSSESLICLPNHVVVRVVNQSSSPLDKISD